MFNSGIRIEEYKEDYILYNFLQISYLTSVPKKNHIIPYYFAYFYSAHRIRLAVIFLAYLITDLFKRNNI